MWHVQEKYDQWTCSRNISQEKSDKLARLYTCEHVQETYDEITTKIW